MMHQTFLILYAITKIGQFTGIVWRRVVTKINNDNCTVPGKHAAMCQIWAQFRHVYRGSVCWCLRVDASDSLDRIPVGNFSQ